MWILDPFSPRKSRGTRLTRRPRARQSGVGALIERPRRKANLSNRIDLRAEQAVIEYALEEPAQSQVRSSNEPRKQGIFEIACGCWKSKWPLEGLILTAS